MNKFLSCLLVLLLSQDVFSQKDYFVYLQSEGGQPFFVRMNEKNYASSARGYLILSRMRDSSYTFRLGWPGSPDENPYFTVKVSGRDRGLLLKNFPGEGWGLFDLQSLEIIRAGDAPAGTSPVKLEPRQVSNFTDVLAKAANDPTLRMKEVKVEKPQETVQAGIEEKQSPAVAEKEEAKREDPVVAEAKEEEMKVETVLPVAEQSKPVAPPADTLSVVKTADITMEEKQAPAEKEEVKAKALTPPAELEKPDNPQVQSLPAQDPVRDYSRSRVTRGAESSTTEGFSLIFYDEYADGKRDTVRILIPAGSNAWQKPPAAPVAAAEKKFLDIPVTAADTLAKKTVPANTCSRKAGESDFLRLRKKMAASTTDDGMIREARKGFEEKCYTVKQVRNLGALFLNDAAKFQFFEAATNYISDAENLPLLGDDLKNEYYLRRFKKVLEER